MRFRLEVDLDKVSGEPVAELTRILRYWGGNVKHYPMEVGSGESVWTATTEVGRWEITADEAKGEKSGG